MFRKICYKKFILFLLAIVFIGGTLSTAYALTGNGTQEQPRNGHLEVKEAYFYAPDKSILTEDELVTPSSNNQFNITLRIYDHNKLSWATAGEKVDIALKDSSGKVLTKKTFYTNENGYVYGHVIVDSLPLDFYLDVTIEAKVIKLNGVASEIITSPTFSIDLLDRSSFNVSINSNTSDILLSWEAVEGAVKYKIINDDLGQVYEGSSLSYKSSFLESGTIYLYTLLALDPNNNVINTAEITAITSEALISEDLNVNTIVSNKTIKLDWSSSYPQSQSGYSVLKDGVEIGITQDNTFIDNSVDYNHEYLYTIQPINNEQNPVSIASDIYVATFTE